MWAEYRSSLNADFVAMRESLPSRLTLIVVQPPMEMAWWDDVVSPTLHRLHSYRMYYT